MLMPDWRDYLSAAERDEIDGIPAKRKALTARYRLIYDRCRKRMEQDSNRSR
jgi:hypothetical protein